MIPPHKISSSLIVVLHLVPACLVPGHVIKIKIYSLVYSSCEIEYFVETHLCKLCVILRSRVLRVVCPMGNAICDTVSQIRPLICDTTLRWRQTPQIVFKLPKVCRHGVRLPLKLSLSQNGPVLEKICGILGQQTSVQTASQTSPLFATPRCVRGRQLRLTPKLPRVCRHGVRLPLKLSLSQKRASTRGDMWYLGATEKSPEWLRT